MNHLQAVHYRDPQGFEPVRDFVDALPEQIQAAADLDLFLDVLYAPLTQRWLTRSGPLVTTSQTPSSTPHYAPSVLSEQPSSP